MINIQPICTYTYTCFAECCAPIIACIQAIWRAVCECIATLFCYAQDKPIQKPCRNLTDLPHNIIEHLSGFLDLYDYFATQQVSRRLKVPFVSWATQLGHIDVHFMSKYSDFILNTKDSNKQEPLVLSGFLVTLIETMAKSIIRLDLNNDSGKGPDYSSFKALFSESETQYPSLQSLNFDLFGGEPIDRDEWTMIFARIVKNCPALTSLSIHSYIFHDGLAVLLKNLNKLTEIELYPFDKFEKLAELLKGLANIEKVKIHLLRFPEEPKTDVDQKLITISEITKLKMLSLCGSDLTEGGLKTGLARCHFLEELSLRQVAVDREILTCLSKMSNLTSLQIANPPTIDSRNFIYITGFIPKLWNFELFSTADKCKEVENVVLALQNLDNLTKLSINVVTAEILRNISRIPNLRILNLGFSKECEVLHLGQHLLHLTKAPHLEMVAFTVEPRDTPFIRADELLNVLLQWTKLKQFCYYDQNPEPKGLDWRAEALKRRPDLNIVKGK